jgi:hypothetical protein
MQNDWLSLASQVVVGLIDGVPILIDEGVKMQRLGLYIRLRVATSSGEQEYTACG